MFEHYCDSEQKVRTGKTGNRGNNYLRLELACMKQKTKPYTLPVYVGMPHLQSFTSYHRKLCIYLQGKRAESESGGNWNRMGTETERTGMEPGHDV